MSEKREYTFGLRMNENEKAQFERAAHKEGLDLTAWIRQVIEKESRKVLGLV